MTGRRLLQALGVFAVATGATQTSKATSLDPNPVSCGEGTDYGGECEEACDEHAEASCDSICFAYNASNWISGINEWHMAFNPGYMCDGEPLQGAFVCECPN